MWCHLEHRDYRYFSARTGVAISDSPQEPFTFIAGNWPLNVTVEQKNKHWIDETIKASQATWINSKVDYYKYNILGMNFKNGQMARDMALFVDDDGSAYQIYSSEHNSTLHISELTDGYLGHKGEYIRVFPNRYMEAPAVFKHDGKYYLNASTTTGWEPNTARSAIADNIMGPWKELGDPMIGESNNGYSKTQTFGGQSTYVLPVQGKKDAYIAMFDKWNPDNAIDGRYIWLPVQFTLNDEFRVPWFDQ
ncbi:family 43 glycosylhydrolase [Vibrio mediterranei]|uniref:family 43 glycosylhydrolase n=1 Tax=Vibrio mediterranei TaxID=689 RepID=UPI0022843C71|nr:family 43 glycosylhydrolase [Vibrio mediterranei]MCY9855090.1 family 43 glycosylhydrolase [Vibrio mediterranei]